MLPREVLWPVVLATVNALLLGWAIRFVWLQAEAPDAGMGRDFYTLWFPAALFLPTAILAAFFAVRAFVWHRSILAWDGALSFLALPALLLIVGHRHLVLWEKVLQALYVSYVFLRWSFCLILVGRGLTLGEARRGTTWPVGIGLAFPLAFLLVPLALALPPGQVPAVALSFTFPAKIGALSLLFALFATELFMWYFQRSEEETQSVVLWGVTLLAAPVLFAVEVSLWRMLFLWLFVYLLRSTGREERLLVREGVLILGLAVGGAWLGPAWMVVPWWVLGWWLHRRFGWVGWKGAGMAALATFFMGLLTVKGFLPGYPVARGYRQLLEALNHVATLLAEGREGLVWAFPFAFLGVLGLWLAAERASAGVWFLGGAVAAWWGIEGAVHVLPLGKATPFDSQVIPVIVLTGLAPLALSRLRGWWGGACTGLLGGWGVCVTWGLLVVGPPRYGEEFSPIGLLRDLFSQASPAVLTYLPFQGSWPPQPSGVTLLALSLFLVLLWVARLWFHRYQPAPLPEHQALSVPNIKSAGAVEASFLGHLWRQGEAAFLAPAVFGLGALVLLLWAGPPVQQVSFGDGPRGQPAKLPAEFSLKSPFYTEKLVVESTLSNSVGIEQGTEIALVTIKDDQGGQHSYPLRAGVHTAEWAHDRPDVEPVIKHQKAPVASLRREVDRETGQVWNSYIYQGEISFPKGFSAVAVEVRETGAVLTLHSLRLTGCPRLKPLFPEPLEALPQPLALTKENPSWETSLTSWEKRTITAWKGKLANAALVPQGEVVAQVKVTSTSLRTDDYRVRAGWELAEWAFHREDVQHAVKCRLPIPLTSGWLPGPSSPFHPGFSYASWYASRDAFTPQKVRVEVPAGVFERFPTLQVVFENFTFQ